MNLWRRHAAEWRDPAQIASQWREARDTDPRLLRSTASGDWWDLLDQFGITLLVTREYEHLVMALSARSGRIRQTFFPMPHPSGLTVDRNKGEILVASTRNPNQVFAFQALFATQECLDANLPRKGNNPLIPVQSVYYPGCLYLHDLVIIAGQVHANAAGQNVVLRLESKGKFERVWWPRCIEVCGEPVFSKNHIQLNSIAAGETLESSFFTASSTTIGKRRPGHLNYRVDGQGVLFDGKTREPVCTGLTRPHSARIGKDRVWLANSGYGELGYVRDGRLEVITRLRGWTRGLCLVRSVAFIATSRVIPAYSRYAPGLDATASRCGIYAVCLKTGKVLGSLEWPFGNQVFAVDWIADKTTDGFVFESGKRRTTKERNLFFSYRTHD